MDEEQLMLVVVGLNELIKKFKRNDHPGDDWRLRAALDAKKAIRKVILSIVIKGDVKEIVPVIVPINGAGWAVTDYNNDTFYYHAK
jgi:hypothetical protein